MESLETKHIGFVKSELINKRAIIGDYSFIGEQCEGLSNEALRKLAIELRDETPNQLLVLTSVFESKPFVVVGIGDLLSDRKNLDAVKIIKEIVTPLMKGGGGGHKTLATAGGQDPNSLPAIIARVKALI
jgi:alanyl-tRNA synthetase